MSENIKINVDVNDNKSTKKLVKDATALGTEYDKAATAAERLANVTKKAAGGTAGSRKAADLSGQDYGVARGTAGTTGASARDFANQAQGLGGLVRLYATYAANVFAVTTAFNALSRAMDTTNMVAGLDALGASAGRNLGGISTRIVELTDGAISLREAMSAVAKGSAAGLTSVQLERLASVAKSSSIALGVDMTDAINRLSRGISKLEPELLDELGIFTKIGPAVANYAASIGKSESSLTDFERRQAFANAVLEEGEKKFAAINEELSANPYNKLTASIQNMTFQGLELINKVLAPIVELLSQSPTALLGVMGILGSRLLRQAGVAVGEYQNTLQRASQQLTEFNAERLNNMTQASDKAASILNSHIDAAAVKQIAAFEEAEARFRDTIARTTKTFRQTNLTKLFDPSTAIQEITEEQWKKAEKRLNDLRKLEKLSSEQSLELRAGEELFKTRLIEETYIKERKLEEAKLQQTLQNSKTYISLNKSIEASRQKALQNQIAGNAVQNRQLFGTMNALSILKAEIASYGSTITKQSVAWTYFKTGVGVATNAVKLLGAAINRAFFYLTIAFTAFEIFKAVAFDAVKEAQEFSSALDSNADAVENVHRTIKTFEKSAGSLSQYTVSGAVAMSNAFTELSVNVERVFDKFEALNSKMSVWEKSWDWIKGLVNASSADNLAASISEDISAALPLLERAGLDQKYRLEWEKILGVDSLEENIEKVLELLAEDNPKAIRQFIASYKQAQKELASTSGAFDSLKNSAEAFIKSQNEFFQSTASKDPLFNLAEGALKFGNDMEKAFAQGEKGITAFYDVISSSPEVLGAFSDSIRQNIVDSFSEVRRITSEIGILQKEIFALEKEAAANQKALKTATAVITRQSGPAPTGIVTSREQVQSREYSILSEQGVEALNKLGQATLEAADKTALLAAKQETLAKLSSTMSAAHDNVIRQAEALISSAVRNAQTLASATVDKAVATFLTGEARAKVMAEATRKELAVREGQIRINMQQTDAMVTLTETIAQLNAIETERLEREKANLGDVEALAKLGNLEASRRASQEALDAFYNGGTKVLSEAAQIVLNRLVSQTKLRTGQQQAALATLGGERTAAELGIISEASKGRTQDILKILDAEKRALDIRKQSLDLARRENTISEKEYISKKLEVSEEEAFNQLLKEQAPLVENIRAIREAMALRPQDSAKLIEQEKKYYKELAENQANFEAKIKFARADADAEERSRIAKEFEFRVENALKLRELEVTGAENALELSSQRVSMEEAMLDFQVEKGLLTEQQAVLEKRKNALALASSEKENRLSVLKLNYTKEAIALQLKFNTATEEQRQGILEQSEISRKGYEEQVAQEEALFDLKIQNIEQSANIEYEKTYLALRTSIEEALLEGGKEGSKKLREILEAEFRKPFNLVLKALMKPVVDIITSVSTTLVNSLTGVAQQAMGFGGSGGGGSSGNLVSNLSNLYSTLKGGSAGMVGSLGSGISSVGNFLGSSTIAGFGQGVSYGAGFGSKAAMLSSFSEVGVPVSNAMSAGASTGSFLASAGPYIAAAAALYAVYKSFAGGEKRSGSTYGFSAEGNISESLKVLGGESLSPGIIRNMSGPSGGPIGGAEGEQRTKALFEATLGNINSLFESLGSEARIDEFWGKLEVSENNRGGVLVGGRLTTGQAFGEVPNKESSNYKGNLFEEYSSKSPDAETALKDFTLDLGQSMLQAVKAAADTLPEQISRLFKEDLDIELMNQEEVNAMIEAINSTRQLIKAAELLNIPLGILTERMITAAGGASQLNTSLTSYYQNFYTEQEQIAKAMEALGKDFEVAGLKLPATREEFRTLAESLIALSQGSLDSLSDLSKSTLARLVPTATTENADLLYAKLISLNGVFADLVPATEELAEELDELKSILDYAAEAGLGADNFAELLRESLLGNIAPEELGATVGTRIKEGFYNTFTNFYTDQVSELITSRLINPIVTSLAEGSITGLLLTKDAVATLASDIKNIAAAYKILLSSPEYLEAIELVTSTITEVMNSFKGEAKEVAEEVAELKTVLDFSTLDARSLADTLKKVITGEVQATEIGKTVGQQIKQGFLDTFTDFYVTQISEKITGSLINPILMSLAEGAVTGLIVTKTTIETLTNDIRTISSVYKALLSSSEFKTAIQEISGVVSELMKELAGVLATPGTMSKAIEYEKELLELREVRQVKVIEDLIEAENNRNNELSATLDRLRRFSTSLKELAQSLLLNSQLSPLTPAQKYLEASKLLEQTYQQALAGDEAAQDRFSTAVNDFLDASRLYYASSELYTADFNRVQFLVESLAASTDAQITETEQLLNTSNEQLVVLQTQLDALNKSYDTLEKIDARMGELLALIAQEAEVYAKGVASSFTSLDTNIDGLLTKEELIAAGVASEEGVTQLIKAIDTDGSNTISRLEALIISSTDTVYGINDITSILLSLRNDIPEALVRVTELLNANTAAGRTSPDMEATYRASVNALYSSIGVSGGQGVRADSLVSMLSRGDLALSGLSDYFYGEVKKEMLEDPETAAHIQAYRAGAGLPPLAKGTNWLPETMPILAHEGERIIPKADNERLINSMANKNSTNEAMLQEIIKLNKKIERLEQVIAEGDIMNAQATERNTAQVSQAVKETSTNTQFEKKLRRRTEVV